MLTVLVCVCLLLQNQISLDLMTSDNMYSSSSEKQLWNTSTVAKVCTLEWHGSARRTQVARIS